jgi:hypothetical protein
MGYKSTYDITREVAEQVIKKRIDKLGSDKIFSFFGIVDKHSRFGPLAINYDAYSIDEIKDFILKNLKNVPDEEVEDLLEEFEESYFRNYSIVKRLNPEEWHLVIKEESDF